MSRKEKTTIYINGEVKRKAAEKGLNISQVCENALKIITANVSNAYTSLKPGFEPGVEARAPAHMTNMGHRLPEPTTGVQVPTAALPKFKTFLEVDLNRAERTVYGHLWQMGMFSDWLEGRTVTTDTIREYLLYLKQQKPGEYKNALKTLKVFFRDFFKRGDLVASFKFPSRDIPLKSIPGKDKLQQFYAGLVLLDLRAGCYFLLYATSGWRFKEVFALHREDADLEARILTHRLKPTATKGRIPGFFNEEAQKALRKWYEKRSDKSPKLLPINERNLRLLWRQAEEETGVHLTPQMLREWFCEEMSNLGVPDRYIDAFCGRVPKSVLAKHYTDYLPEKLKPIYDKAGLKVLS